MTPSAPPPTTNGADPGPGPGPRAPAAGARLIGATAIRRGLTLNVIGAVAPAVVAIFCIRAIVGGLGPARFGVLSLAWVFINSMGILDLGIGRALTRFLAVHEEPDARREAATVWTALVAILALGALGGGVAWGFADALATSLAHGDEALRTETALALRILAVSVPSVLLSSGLRGVLEAFGRFDLTNRVSIPVTLLNLILPVVLLRFGASLPAIVSSLVLLRIAGTLLLMQSAIHLVPAMRSPRLRATGMASVLVFAGWVTSRTSPGRCSPRPSAISWGRWPRCRRSRSTRRPPISSPASRSCPRPRSRCSSRCSRRRSRSTGAAPRGWRAARSCSSGRRCCRS